MSRCMGPCKIFLVILAGTEIDPRICKISENIFYLANLKVLIKLPTLLKNESPPTQGHVVILSSKNGFQKQMGTKKSVIGLSKSILLITIEFLIKFRVYGWIQNFEILFHSRVMSYESFFEKLLYDSYMTHNIYNIHII